MIPMFTYLRKTLYLAILSSICTLAYADTDAQRDPYEIYNRPVFEFNMFLDRAILKPVAKTYAKVTPKSIRSPLETILSQLAYPISAINYALSGEWNEAGRSIAKLGVNIILTFGTADIDIDGKPYTHKTFTQTLAQNKVASGNYIVLPIAGHNMARGHAGKAITMTTQTQYPKPSIISTPILAFIQTIVTRAKIMDASDSFEETSLDYYATVRSVTIQRSDSLGKTDALNDFQDFDFSEQ